MYYFSVECKGLVTVFFVIVYNAEAVANIPRKKQNHKAKF